MIEIVINLVVLLFLSALFSGAETAFTSLNLSKVEVIRKDGKFASKTLTWLYDRLDIVIMVNLIVSNAVNIMISAYITVLFTSIFSDGRGLTYSVAVGTFLILVFGEILPKKLAILFPIAFSRFAAHILYLLYYLTYPIVIPLSKTMRVFDKLADKNGKNENDVSEDEITAMLAIGEKDGALEQKEHQMIKKLLKFNDRKVKEIMTRRYDVIAVKDNITLKELLDVSSENNLSRFPVFKNDINECDFIISIPKIIPYLKNVNNLDKQISSFNLAKSFKVPESKIIDDLFFEFQKKRVHMAIVINEYGEMSGIITLEDIIEAVFGNIEDETDIRENKIKKLDNGSILVDGDVSVEECEENLGVKISSDKYPSEKTISWLILEILHTFPNSGQNIFLKNRTVKLTVVKMDDEYIDKVKIEHFCN